MDKILDSIDGIVKKLNGVLWSLSGYLLLLISLAVSYDVITRYIFKYSNEWVGEYCGYMLVCIAFLAAPHTLHVGGMTRVDLIVNAVRPRVKWIITIITGLLALLYLVVLFRVSLTLMMRSLARGWRSQTSLRTPLWIPQIAIPAGTILMILSSLVVLAKNIITVPKKDVPKRKKLTDEELAKQILEEAKEEAGGAVQDLDDISGESAKKEGQ